MSSSFIFFFYFLFSMNLNFLETLKKHSLQIFPRLFIELSIKYCYLSIALTKRNVFKTAVEYIFIRDADLRKISFLNSKLIKCLKQDLDICLKICDKSGIDQTGIGFYTLKQKN